MATLSRRQLYYLVWSKPMRDGAADIGLSDVGLKKVCLRHRVPVPPQGYWNKVRAGHKPRKILFREVPDPALDRVHIGGGGNQLPADVAKALAEAKARGRDPGHRFDVSMTLPASPLAVRLAAALKKAKANASGVVSAADPELLSAQVAPSSIDRAVALVDALLRAAANRGMAAVPGDKHLRLTVDGETLGLSLKEVVERRPHVLTPEQSDRQARRQRALQAGNWAVSSRLYETISAWDYRVTGRLVLAIEDRQAVGVRTRWPASPAGELAERRAGGIDRLCGRIEGAACGLGAPAATVGA